jgi:hypothetical protein
MYIIYIYENDTILYTLQNCCSLLLLLPKWLIWLYRWGESWPTPPAARSTNSSKLLTVQNIKMNRTVLVFARKRCSARTHAQLHRITLHESWYLKQTSALYLVPVLAERCWVTTVKLVQRMGWTLRGHRNSEIYKYNVGSHFLYISTNIYIYIIEL